MGDPYGRRMDRTKDRNRTFGTWAGLGLVIGAGAGVVLGSLGIGDLAIGVGVGAGLGLVLGSVVGLLRSRD
jgi:hypothetical protein